MTATTAMEITFHRLRLRLHRHISLRSKARQLRPQQRAEKEKVLARGAGRRPVRLGNLLTFTMRTAHTLAS
jgi:hypothetical protein